MIDERLPRVAGLILGLSAAVLLGCGSSSPQSDGTFFEEAPRATPAPASPGPTHRPSATPQAPTANPCDVDPNGCACMATSCLPIPPGLEVELENCAPAFLPGECADVMLAAFNAGGCGETCKALRVPGLEQLCEMPACHDFLDLAGLLGSPDLCQCYCEPQCGGRVCGSDGCGGVCGGCDDGESCGFGECLRVEGECRDSDFNCFCAALECSSPVPTGPRLSLCMPLSMDFPECHEIALRAYAAEGCGAEGEPQPFIGTSAICAAPACEGFRTYWRSRIGTELCPRPSP